MSQKLWELCRDNDWADYPTGAEVYAHYNSIPSFPPDTIFQERENAQNARSAAELNPPNSLDDGTKGGANVMNAKDAIKLKMDVRSNFGKSNPSDHLVLGKPSSRAEQYHCIRCMLVFSRRAMYEEHLESLHPKDYIQYLEDRDEELADLEELIPERPDDYEPITEEKQEADFDEGKVIYATLPQYTKVSSRPESGKKVVHSYGKTERPQKSMAYKTLVPLPTGIKKVMSMDHSSGRSTASTASKRQIDDDSTFRQPHKRSCEAGPPCGQRAEVTLKEDKDQFPEHHMEKGEESSDSD